MISSLPNWSERTPRRKNTNGLTMTTLRSKLSLVAASLWKICSRSTRYSKAKTTFTDFDVSELQKLLDSMIPSSPTNLYHSDDEWSWKLNLSRLVSYLFSQATGAMLVLRPAFGLPILNNASPSKWQAGKHQPHAASRQGRQRHTASFCRHIRTHYTKTVHITVFKKVQVTH